MEGRFCLEDLGAVATEALRRTRPQVRDGAAAELEIRSLRLKPGRRLTVLLAPRRANGPRSWVSLMLDAAALEGTRLRFGPRRLARAPVESQAPGIAALPDLGLTVGVFPADAGLPTLAGALETEPAGPVCRSLERAGQCLLDDPGWSLARVRGKPLRYKIADRCVIAYRLAGRDGRCASVVAKLYADPSAAANVNTVVERLHRALGPTQQVLPRALGCDPVLALAFSQRIEPAPPQQAHARVTTRLGTAAMAGRTLAQLHTAPTDPAVPVVELGPREAGRVRERAARLASWQPALAARLADLAGTLAEQLDESRAPGRAFVHGAYKPSQLVLTRDGAYAIDFDAACLGDPAADLGCFLAYLRPAAAVRDCRRAHEWYSVAAADFLRAYRETTIASGGDAGTLPEVLDRAYLYEASRLLKIATRRLHRLNSPRPAELSSICDEIAGCLKRKERCR